jgi:hypothetical protein
MPVTAGVCTLATITQYPNESGLPNRVQLAFNEAVYWQSALEDTTHLKVIVDGTGRTFTTLPVRAKGNASTTVDIMYGGPEITDGQTISVEITDAGAALIQSASTSQPMAAGISRSTVYQSPPDTRPSTGQKAPLDVIYIPDSRPPTATNVSASRGIFNLISYISIPLIILMAALVVLAYVSRRRPPGIGTG